MSYLIAAAGTGGHVFPGLAVGEALVDFGVPRRDVLYVGGSRLEATVYPDEGFPFLGLSLRGLRRSLSPKNLTLPWVVMAAKRRIEEAIRQRGIVSALGMGGYVTIPTALAARSQGTLFSIAEQNAEAGLANRIACRWARHCHVSFPGTGGLPGGEWVGNPVREAFWSFDREALRDEALARYRLKGDRPVLGVFGGSLGAGVINEAVGALAVDWDGPPLDIVHLTGPNHLGTLEAIDAPETVTWRRIGFEDSMELFYAAVDLVVARAGGAVAELTATATPAILVPGRFGSTGHQIENARFLSDRGAAIIVSEAAMRTLPQVVSGALHDRERLDQMAASAREISRPNAAHDIARAMMEAS